MFAFSSHTINGNKNKVLIIGCGIRSIGIEKKIKKMKRSFIYFYSV